MSSESRRHPRTPIELKVEYRKLNTFFFDYTRNISKGGTFIKTPRPLEIGTEFVFKLAVPRLDEPLTLNLIAALALVLAGLLVGNGGRKIQPVSH